jgi:hypothetical protein
MTLTALALTSAGRFWPLGPLGIFLLVDFDQTLIPGNPSLSGLDGGGSHVNALTNLKLEIRGLARLKVSKDQSIGLQLFTQVIDDVSEFAHDPMLFAKHGTDLGAFAIQVKAGRAFRRPSADLASVVPCRALWPTDGNRSVGKSHVNRSR